MKRFKRILAATDLSPESASAVRYAGHLAVAEDAKLTVCYVPPTLALTHSHVVPVADVVALDAQVREASSDRLDAWVARHLKHVPKVTTVLGDGSPAEEICRIAEAINAGLVVVATHGRRGLSHAVMGSVAERVVRSAACPVLVIRPPKAAAAKRKPAKKAARKKTKR